ncbi:hypothetical protein [Lampropedia cohaerens]|nr:hypothetical protein [Lampropedia cohaerens]
MLPASIDIPSVSTNPEKRQGWRVSLATLDGSESKIYAIHANLWFVTNM